LPNYFGHLLIHINKSSLHSTCRGLDVLPRRRRRQRQPLPGRHHQQPVVMRASPALPGDDGSSCASKAVACAPFPPHPRAVAPSTRLGIPTAPLATVGNLGDVLTAKKRAARRTLASRRPSTGHRTAPPSLLRYAVIINPTFCTEFQNGDSN